MGERIPRGQRSLTIALTIILFYWTNPYYIWVTHYYVVYVITLEMIELNESEENYLKKNHIYLSNWYSGPFFSCFNLVQNAQIFPIHLKLAFYLYYEESFSCQFNSISLVIWIYCVINRNICHKSLWFL